MRVLALAALALLAGYGTAAAQSTGSTAGTTGTASATNSVYVTAYTGAGNGSTGTTATDGSGTGANGQPSRNVVEYKGHEWTTPAVQGSYFAGANPCLIGIGAGGAGGPIGLSINWGRSDGGCQRRSDAAAWHALGRDDVAIARMCQDDDNREAFEAVGNVCPQNRAKVVRAAAMAPAPAPQPVPAPAPVQVARQPARPDWCETVTGTAERAYYKSVCGF